MVIVRRHVARRALTLCLLLCGAVGAVTALRRPLGELELEIALHDTIRLLNERHNLGAPLLDDATTLARLVARFRSGPENRFDAAARLLDAAPGTAGRDRYAAAVAELAGNRPDRAVARFASIPLSERDASMWTSLALAQLLLAEKENHRDHILAALASTNRALGRDPSAVEVWFIRATAFEKMGLLSSATAAWRPYLAARVPPAWRAIATSRKTACETPNDTAAWNQEAADLPSLSSGAIAEIVRRYPQQARTYGESVYLSAWADAVSGGRTKIAESQFRVVRTIANALHEDTGEALLFDVVKAIDADVNRRRPMARGLYFYRRGRLLLRDHRPSDAVPDLLLAERLFSSASSPMKSLAKCYSAIARVDQNRPSDARRELRVLIASEKAGQSRHDALVAFALYHLALCDGTEGQWSDALRAAEESLAIFRRLREPGSTGLVESLVSEAYDFLGQPQLAWQHATSAMRLLTEAGDATRARIMLAGLCHFELRRGRWDFAQALIGAEHSMAKGTPNALLDCDMYLRLAAAEYHLGFFKNSNRALTRARTSARSMSDRFMQAKLLADVSGVEGSLLRGHDSRKAVRVLSEAIDFGRRSGRNVLLPQLYLERGRAFVSIGDLDSAAEDFERGIDRLEEQRDPSLATEIRSGIFGDAGEIFQDAVALAVRRNHGLEAWQYVERARARSALEELAAKDRSLKIPTLVSITRLQKSLPRGLLLIEYTTLEDKLVIFTLRRDGMTVLWVNKGEKAVRREVDDFVSALLERKSMANIVPRSKELFATLLAPIGERLSLSTSLVIIPDESLQHLPFAALVDSGTGRFLVEQFHLIESPSAALYAVCIDEVGNAFGGKPTTAAFFADPSLEGSEFESLAPLPAADVEARTASRFYPQRELITGSEATASRFVAEAPLHDVVHFGGHTIIRGNESGLVMVPDRDSGALLSVRRISRMSFRRTQTVVLASCATIRGFEGGVEGVSSVARAFLIAGVPAVVGTLWDVEDGGAGILMVALHEGLARGDSPAEALRNAQLASLRYAAPEIRHPGYWSVFVLLGASRMNDRSPR